MLDSLKKDPQLFYVGSAQFREKGSNPHNNTRELINFLDSRDSHSSVMDALKSADSNGKLKYHSDALPASYGPLKGDIEAVIYEDSRDDMSPYEDNHIYVTWKDFEALGRPAFIERNIEYKVVQE